MRSGRTAVPILLLLGVASFPAAAQTDVPCPEAYRADYLPTWSIDRNYWNASCQDNFKPIEILREGQRRYIRDCIRDFAQHVADKKATLEAVEKLCGQGAPGKAKLAKALGVVPPPPEKPAAPAEAARKPRGMGPLGEAIRAARSGWQADACLCGMQQQSVYAREELADFTAPEKVRDDFTYYFRSAESPDSYRIAYRGSKDPERGSGANKFNDICISRVDVDVDKALSAAAKQGLAMEPDPGHARRTELRLQVYPKDHFAKWKLDEPTARKMRSIEGKPVWLAVTESGGKGRTAMIDAGTGAVVVVLPRALFLE